MPRTSQLAFGRRNVQPSAAARPWTGVHTSAAGKISVDDAVDPSHSAFFATVRAEMADTVVADTQAIRWSWKAAWLTGLLVGCALAGFDVTGQAGADQFAAVAKALGAPPIDGSKMLPAMIALGLIGGARVAGMTVFCAHALLAAIGWTNYLAYALGGAAASGVFAAFMQAATAHPPTHGWPIELMAGAGAGFCYRALAGARSKAAKA